MKHLLKTVIASLAVMLTTGTVSSLQGAPLLTVTDNLDLYATALAQEQYNTNILSSAGNKKDAFVATLAPGIDLDYGKNTDTTINVAFYESFLFYSNGNGDLNTDLANVFVNGERVQGAWDIKANFSWQQQYTNTPSSIIAGVSTNSILRSNVTNVGTKVSYTISEKFYASTGFTFSQTVYGGAAASAYQNLQSYYVPLNVYYVYSEKFDIGAAYYLNYATPANSNNTIGADRYDNFIGASVKFKQWEKVTGKVSVGVDFNHLNATTGSPALAPPNGPILPAAGQNNTNLAYDMQLQYDYSPKLSFFLDGQRNFQAGALGQNILVTSVNLTGHYAYSDFVSFDGTFLGFSNSDYKNNTPARTDNAYNFGFAANWTPTTYLTLSAGYTYFNNSSNLPGNTYNINLVTISANVRY